MKKKINVLSSALVSALVMGGAVSTAAHAAEVNCKGIATKWVNDCQANGHECASQAKSNFDKEEWLKMDKGDCKAVQAALKNDAVKKYIEKIQKGTVVASKRGKKF